MLLQISTDVVYIHIGTARWTDIDVECLFGHIVANILGTMYAPVWDGWRSGWQTDFEVSRNAAGWNALGDGHCMPFGDSFKPMLALFAWESRELAIGNGIIRDLPISYRSHMVSYGFLASHGCHTWLLAIFGGYVTVPIKPAALIADRCQRKIL